MKFCPQCGTSFEPDTRFCQECGFDKSTVESFANEPVATPQVMVDEPPAVTGAQAEIQEIKPGCPRCGTKIAPGDRFCPECGFDASSSPAANAAIPEIPVAGEIIPPAIIVEKPTVPMGNRQFCPQCGMVIVSDERFCQECGFDTQSKVDTGKTTSDATIAGPAFSPPPVASVSTPPKASKPIPAPAPEPVLHQTYQQHAPAGTPTQVKKESSKRPLMMILLVILGVCVLVAGGWFVYTKFIASPVEETIAETTTSNIASPEPIITDTPEPEAEIAVTPTETTTEKPKAGSKPKSKIDQELEKYREQEKNKAAQQSTSSQTTKSNPGVKISPVAGGSTIATKVIHEVGRKEEPKNKKPKNPVKLTLQKPTMIVRITTDHYNDGMGTSGAGNITLKDRDGNTLGIFKASGKTGTGGAPNAKWVAEPNKMFEKGTYYIWDSDFSTWSKNFVGTGFVVVEGYEID